MPSFNAISPDRLFRLLGGPDAPAILDVRVDEDVAADPHIAPTAQRIAHDALARRAPEFAGRRVAVACHAGKKLSQAGASMLRAHGVPAEYVDGGFVAWRAAGLPAVPIDVVPARSRDGGTLWVTRHRPKIDRIACPWLIRRFVDPDAQFLFVAPGEVDAAAERFGATPFDVEDVFFSHRGPRCTFDTMIDAFGLATDALRRLATVVRAADTNAHHLAPQAAGLLAVSVGLSRLHRDDHAQLEAGLALYDALYRWARDGVDEGHDWPNPSPSGVGREPS